MDLTFLGAAKEVTGSSFLLEGKLLKILIDCGLFQGGKEADVKNKAEFPYDPAQIDFLLLTHAHIDHSGMIPKLVKEGFQGRIIATKATFELCQIMLKDSAHIQEMEAEWASKRERRKGHPPIAPLYTMEDAEKALSLFEEIDYDYKIQLNDQVNAVFRNAGHILGSAVIKITYENNNQSKDIVFTGDLGREDQPIVRDPHFVKNAHHLVIESTYGNRYHENGPEEKREQLFRILDEAFKKNGKIIIPAFAVARTQDLLYELNLLIEQKKIPSIPIYIDSPLAISATDIFSQNPEYFDKKTAKLISSGDNPFDFPGLSFTRTVEESKALNEKKEPAIIISASGMCEAGRIKHHLKHNLWRPEATILFIGYQAKRTLGRRIVDGAKQVKVFGEDISVKAQIRSIEGFSSHADKNELIDWVENLKDQLQQIFVVHGDEEASEELAHAFRDRYQIDTFVPERGQRFDLSDKDFIRTDPDLHLRETDKPFEKDSQLRETLSDFQDLLDEFNQTALAEEVPNGIEKLTRLKTDMDEKMLKIIREKSRNKEKGR